MNLKELQYFCAVVEAGSANGAAAQLHVVPAAVSMQLGQLEDQLGGKLFDRSTRPMTLTPLGRFFYPKARAVLSDTSRMLEEAQDLSAGRLGWLSIGFTRSTIFSVLPEAVRALNAVAPKVRIDLTEILTEHQSDALRAGQIHIGLARAIGDFSTDAETECIPLFDDPLVAALPVTSPLARRKTVTPSELVELAYISYPKDPNSSFARHALQALENAGAKARVSYEAKEIHTALGLVAAGLGFTLVGQSVADGQRTDMRFRPVRGLKTLAKVFATRRKGVSHQLADAFLDILKAQALTR